MTFQNFIQYVANECSIKMMVKLLFYEGIENYNKCKFGFLDFSYSNQEN